MAYYCDTQKQSAEEFAKFTGIQLYRSLFFNKVEDRLKKRLRQCSLRTLLEICSFKQFFTSIPERFTRKVYFSNKLNSQSIHASVNITKIKNFLRSFSKVFVVETRLSNILGVSKNHFKKAFNLVLLIKIKNTQWNRVTNRSA